MTATGTSNTHVAETAGSMIARGEAMSLSAAAAGAKITAYGDNLSVSINQQGAVITVIGGE